MPIAGTMMLVFALVWSSQAAIAAELPPAGSSVAAQASEIRLVPRYTDVAGTTIGWASLGSGRPLLLLNGTGSPMSHWDPKLLAKLASHRRVIVMDYPGLGVSGPAPKRITFTRLANWTAKFLRSAESGRVDVLGWSMGGFVAQSLVRRHPGLVRRLVLAGTNPGSPATTLGPAWVQRIDSDPDAGLRGYLKTNYPHTARAQRAGKRAVSRINRAIASGRYPSEEVPARTYRQMVAAEGPWLRSARNCRQLSQVANRTLVITGREDLVTPPENSRIIASRIPDTRLRLLPDTGHSFLFQKPGKVARLITGFLDGR